jgi:hypothetical protein
MKVRESEDQLFTEWSKNRSGFVPDGIIDEEIYVQSNPKLLFVLKEVNNFTGDLRNFVKEGGRTQTWNNITRWIEGVRRLPDEIPWEDISEIDEKRRIAALASIIVVNLKKSSGGHTADSKQLKVVGQEDKDYLNKQFLLYDPDIIICCGTSDLFHSIVNFFENPNWKRTSRGIWFHEYKSGKYIVSYHHPEARCDSSILYYGLVDAMREILCK